MREKIYKKEKKPNMDAKKYWIQKWRENEKSRLYDLKLRSFEGGLPKKPQKIMGCLLLDLLTHVTLNHIYSDSCTPLRFKCWHKGSHLTLVSADFDG